MEAQEIIRRKLEKVRGQSFGENPWGMRHAEAWIIPHGSEVGIVGMIRAWAKYADQHRTRYESSIGDDGVLGVEWANIGRALLGLLNGELGRLDGGTLDGTIRDILSGEGCDPDA